MAGRAKFLSIRYDVYLVVEMTSAEGVSCHWITASVVVALDPA